LLATPRHRGTEHRIANPIVPAEWRTAMLDRRRALKTGLAALGAAPFAARFAIAEAYPEHPVRMIIGLPPGSAPDIVARLVGQSLAGQDKQPFVIENRPGAATNLAAQTVVRANPDGYTLLVATATNAVNASLYTNLNFDFVRDIAPVAGIAAIPFVLVVAPSFPAKTVPELIAYAKAQPGKVIMASTGVGGIPHVAGELFKMMAGVDLLHVPYRGSDVAAITELIAGRAQIYFGPVFSVIEQVRAGTLRAIAVTTPKRVDALPQTPSVAEYLPGYDVRPWVGVGAPEHTPADVINKLNAGINAALAVPATRERLADLGAPPLGGSPADFVKLIAADTEKWAEVIKFAGIKPE
jgi:tripartite-type tricarboxylate transporter receptor subunit TctC